MTLEAKDTAVVPGDQINHFKQAVSENRFLSLDKTNGVRLTSLSPPTDKYVLFTLECRYPETTR